MLLGLDEAKHLIEVAHAHARMIDCQVTVAVVDDAGRLIVLERMDGALPIGAHIAEAKACTAAVFRQDGYTRRKIYDERRPNYDALLRWTPQPIYPGGGSIPLFRGQESVGAIGCSGCTTDDQDHACVTAAAHEFHKIL